MNLTDKLKFGQEVEPLPTDLETNRVIKEIPNTTQYTFATEDFIDKFLVFTGGAEIDAILPKDIATTKGEVQGITIGATVLNFKPKPDDATPLATVTPTEGKFPKTGGDRSKFGIKMTSPNDYAVYGDLEEIVPQILEIDAKDDVGAFMIYDDSAVSKESAYAFFRYVGSRNVTEIGTKDEPEESESVALRLERGYPELFPQGNVRFLNPNKGIVLQTPNGNTDPKNDQGNLLILADGDNGFKAIKIGGPGIPDDDIVVWRSSDQGSGGSAKPPLDGTYADVAALLADQNNQEKDYFYEVMDGSGFTGITSGKVWVYYEGGTTGSQVDYTVFSKEEEETIQNITEIPNRSYNDLQDLPSGSVEIIDVEVSSGGSYDINRASKLPVVYYFHSVGSMELPYTITVNDNNQCGNIKIVSLVNNQGLHLAGSNLLPFEGATQKIKTAGTVFIDKVSELYGLYGVSGDLIQEYEIRQSPNGSLWKVSVDDTGNEVITAL